MVKFSRSQQTRAKARDYELGNMFRHTVVAGFSPRPLGMRSLATARITPMSRTVLRLVLAAFVSWTWVLAQEPVYILKVDVPYVSVDVSVQDTAGRTVTDL